MQLDRLVVVSANRLISRVGGRPGAWLRRAFTRVLPVHDVTVRGVGIRCVAPLHQVGTYLAMVDWEQREPEVLDWIDAMTPGSVFFDVGSNFGTETLYASLKPGGPARIIAFDCEFSGSYNLAANLMLNRVNNVENRFAAVGETEGWVAVPENLNYLWVDGHPKYAQAMKMVARISIDRVVADTGCVPTYVKVDVDGPELEVVRGMRRVLGDPSLRSLCIEINSEEAAAGVEALLHPAGFVEIPHGHPNRHNHIFERR